MNKSRELLIHTLNIASNEKVFPKNKRWLITQKIVNECTDCLTCIRKANSVFATNAAEWDYRRSLQVKAYSHLSAMFTLVDVAYETIGIDASRVEYWTQMMTDVNNLLKAWMKSDAEKRASLNI